MARSIRIGSDPELLFLKDGKVYPANRVVQNSTTAEFGTDGNSTVAELRPKPANSVEKVVENIRLALEREVKRNPEILGYEWFAGPAKEGYGLGGHIHFGFRPEDEKFVEALDVLMAVPYMRTEPVAQAKSRKRSYGRLSNTERKPWGFEYRTLSTWMASEEKAFAVLGTAKALANLYAGNRAEFDRIFALAGGPLNDQERSDFSYHLIGALAPRTQKVKAALESLAAAVNTGSSGYSRAKAIKKFIGLCFSSRKGDGTVSWKLNGKTMDELRAEAGLAVADNREQLAAKKAAMAAALEGVALPLVPVPVSQALILEAWEVEAPVSGLCFNAADERLTETFGLMSGRTLGSFTPLMPGSPLTYVYGLRLDRPDHVRVRLGRQVSDVAVQKITSAASEIGLALGLSFSVAVEPELATERPINIGLRLDLRNDPLTCRKVVGTLMLAAGGLLEVA